MLRIWLRKLSRLWTVGGDAGQLMYSDNWGAVIKVCEERGLLVEFSQVGMPHTNSVIEGCSQ
eukprot:3477408-Lingulodinium_polyedra.AAC.1